MIWRSSPLPHVDLEELGDAESAVEQMTEKIEELQAQVENHISLRRKLNAKEEELDKLRKEAKRVRDVETMVAEF